MKARIVQIGNSLGIVLPMDTLIKMNVGKGDVLHLTESPDGIRVTRHDPQLETQMNKAREVIKKRRGALRESPSN